jgi:hypothetical protein
MSAECYTYLEKRKGKHISLECYHYPRSDLELGTDGITVIATGPADHIKRLYSKKVNYFIKKRKLFSATEHFCDSLEHRKSKWSEIAASLPSSDDISTADKILSRVFGNEKEKGLDQ